MERQIDNERAVLAFQAAPADQCGQLFEQIVQSNTGLIIYWLGHIQRRLKYAAPDAWEEDLIQAGRIGLYEAAQKYRSDGGSKFSTYAGYWILKHMTVELRFLSSSVHIPSGRPRSPAAPALSLDSAIPSRYEDALERLRVEEWMVRVVDQDPSPDAITEYRQQADHIAKALTRLSEQKQLILRRYYWEERTLQEIGNELGLTRERIRQIKRDAHVDMARALRRVAA